jgi:hypothetical protein
VREIQFIDVLRRHAVEELGVVGLLTWLGKTGWQQERTVSRSDPS